VGRCRCREGVGAHELVWEPETGSALAALRRVCAQEPESGSMPMFPLDFEEGSALAFLLDSEEGSSPMNS
jgi:hypothetical protein